MASEMYRAPSACPSPRAHLEQRALTVYPERFGHAQLLNIQIPGFFKEIVDTLGATPSNSGQALMTVAGTVLIGCTRAQDALVPSPHRFQLTKKGWIAVC